MKRFKDDELFVGFAYGLSIIMTCILCVLSCVFYIGDLCDGFTFAEGMATGLGFFKAGFKVFEYEIKE